MTTFRFLTCHRLIRALSASLPPGREVYAWESGAADQAVCSGDKSEGDLGDAGDARVVADDPGQGDSVQRLPLVGGEYAQILVPQPVHGKQN